MFADLSIDHKILKESSFKKVIRPCELKDDVESIINTHNASVHFEDLLHTYNVSTKKYASRVKSSQKNTFENE